MSTCCLTFQINLFCVCLFFCHCIRALESFYRPYVCMLTASLISLCVHSCAHVCVHIYPCYSLFHPYPVYLNTYREAWSCIFIIYIHYIMLYIYYVIYIFIILLYIYHISSLACMY